MIRFEYALVVTTATAAVTLAYSPTEPYAAIITVLLPPVFVLAWSGLRGARAGGGWAAIVGVGLFLGVTALFYTLLFGLRRVHDDVMALLVGGRPPQRSTPLLRLLVIAVIAGPIALIGWGRTCWPRPGAHPPTPAPPSTTCPPTARN